MQAIVAQVWKVVGVGSVSLSRLAFSAVMVMVSVLDGMATEVKMDGLLATGGKKILECGWTDESVTVEVVGTSMVAVVGTVVATMLVTVTTADDEEEVVR
jgi:hypothetical protein